ncbi:chromosome partitioning protein ParB [Salmonella enterica subsp. enterica serovar Heidelberg]|jgi:ParB family chromosome partitioning protein|nr:chromosome partitioning protein ParB [Salmonella enterica subsp. enterica serovar Heidelberg]
MSEIRVLKLSQLTPNKKQDRRDWESPVAREHIEKLKKSIGMRMPDGSLYGIRERIVVKPGASENEFVILKGESRWRAGSELEKEIGEEIETECEIKSYDDKVIEHLDHATENSLRRDLNIFERALSIKTDKENGLTTDQIIAAHGLSNKTVVSKYMSVFRLAKPKQKLVQESFIGDLNLIGKLDKVAEDDMKELRQRLEGGETAKKVINELLNRSKPKQEKEPQYRLALSRSQYSAILSLLDLNPEDIDNPEEDIAELLRNRLEELSDTEGTDGQ